jgi:hypothetical protein
LDTATPSPTIVAKSFLEKVTSIPKGLITGNLFVEEGYNLLGFF